MVGRVQDAKLDSRTARGKLSPGRQPHWKAIIPGRVHLGYQRKRGAKEGRWLMRRWIGAKYRVETLGRVDDLEDANGRTILDYNQAVAKLNSKIETGPARIERITVRQAMALYIEDRKLKGKPTADVEGRGAVHILPALGDFVVSELTSDQLQRWLRTMADAPAQNRPGKDGKPQYRPAPDTEEAKRKRRNSANRILTMLKAILNFAHKKKHVASRDAWGSDLERFGEADARRIRFLSEAEAKRLVKACDPDFADLVRAALETGARYSELARLRVQDFSHNGGTLFIEKSKSAKARHIDLTEAGIAFFQRVCAGRSGGDIMLKNLSRAARRVEAEKEKVEAKPSRKSQPLRKLKAGDEWRPSEQVRLMNEACERAAIDPPIVFHELRHTYASILIMNAIPLIMIAENLGHKDTSMVVKHYGHLAPSFKKDMIRERGPKYGLD